MTGSSKGGDGGGGSTTCSSSSSHAEKAGGQVAAGTVRVPGASAALVYREEINALLSLLPGCTRNECFVQVTAKALDLPLTGQTSDMPWALESASGVSEAFYWLGPFNSMPLTDPQIQVSDFEEVPGKPGAVKFTVMSHAVAPMTVWEAGAGVAGRFSDNAVTLLPCVPREVVFYGRGSGDVGVGDCGDLVQRLQQELRVTSLWDHQQLG